MDDNGLFEDLHRMFRVSIEGPKIIQITLRAIRQIADRDEVIAAFVEATKELPEMTLAVVTPGKIDLMSDEWGKLVEAH